MTTFYAVLAATRADDSPAAVARQLGIAPDLVNAMVDEAVRLDLISPAQACGACGPVVVPRACAGCPLVGATAPTP